MSEIAFTKENFTRAVQKLKTLSDPNPEDMVNNMISVQGRSDKNRFAPELFQIYQITEDGERCYYYSHLEEDTHVRFEYVKIDIDKFSFMCYNLTYEITLCHGVDEIVF